MLNIDTFRAIKPPGSRDDYPSGEAVGMSRAENAKAFLAQIMGAIKKKPLSIPQIAKKTGRSRAAIAKRLDTEISRNNVQMNVHKLEFNGAIRPVRYYSPV